MTTGVVLFSAVYIGLEADYHNTRSVHETRSSEWFWLITPQFLCLYFVVELLVRFLAFEHKWNCLHDGWFKVDSFLAFVMVLDLWIILPILQETGGLSRNQMHTLRVLRLLKLTRMTNLLRVFPELGTMTKSLIRSVRAISSSLVLILLLVYICAVPVNTMLKHELEFNAHLEEETTLSFYTVTRSMWALIVAGTLMLDGSGMLMTTLAFSDDWKFKIAGFILILYTFLSATLLLQMLIGVLCDIVTAIGREQRDSRATALVKKALLQDLKQYDDGTGSISQRDLQTVMNHNTSAALFRKLNINQLFLLQLQKMMFAQRQQVPIISVIELMVICRGNNVTTIEALSGGLLSVMTELLEVKRLLQDDLLSKLENQNSTF